MEQFSQILETEMEEAFEVKNRKALRRFDRRFNTLITFLSVGLGLIMAILAYGTFFKG